MSDASEILFRAETPLGFTVRVTRERWGVITRFKHPVMAGCEAEVKLILESPEEIRRSRVDENVLLFYRRRHERRWVCAVCKRSELDSFLITTYPTDAIKEGETIWPT
jgi:hypothetical protein